MVADVDELSALVGADRSAASTNIRGASPLVVLLRDSVGTPADLRLCLSLLLETGADPSASVPAEDGEWLSASYFAVERRDRTLIQMLVDAGADPDDDAFYHACEQGDTVVLDLLHAPGFEDMVNHKLDFEDVAGLQWFLDRGVNLNVQGSLHWAIGRGRSTTILQMLLRAGAEPQLPHPDIGVSPLEAAARCGHLAAYDLLISLGVEAELSATAKKVLAVARGESVQLPDEAPPLPGIPGSDYRWILGQLALLGQLEVVRGLLDSGVAVDSRGWSNFTPLDQAAMHGRVDVVSLLIERGADLNDRAFDDHGPTPLDCAVWGLANNHAEDGDYQGTVEALVAAGARTRHSPPTGNARIDQILTDGTVES